MPAKDPLFLERLFAIFEAIQGPCYVWETFNHVNAATTFKAPDDVASINLLDRLSRAPVALLKGGETALPQALHKIHRLDTGCTVDGTGFPQSLHAILAGS